MENEGLPSELVTKIRLHVLREVKRSAKKTRGKKKFYLIYGVGCGKVSDVDDLRGVLCDRMIADCAVVAHDKTQQAYL